MLHVAAQCLLPIQLNVVHSHSNSLILFDSDRGPMLPFSDVTFPHSIILDRIHILAFKYKQTKKKNRKSFSQSHSRIFVGDLPISVVLKC